MRENIGKTTETALNAIRNQLTMDEKEVIKYLKNSKNFKLLPDLLKETMVLAGKANENSTQTELVNTLDSLLSEVDKSCGDSPKSPKTLKRWMDGTTKSIRDRIDVVKLCFALELNQEQADTLLNKCGFNGFSVRNAEDMTYIYCIKNKQPFSTAKRIIDEYQKSSVSPIPTTTAATPEAHSGNTTLLLRNDILDFSQWQDADDFLNNYLIPKKAVFIGYSTTAELILYTIKNKAYATTIKYILLDEQPYRDLLLSNSHNKLKEEDCAYSFAFRSAIRKYTDPNSPLCPINKDFKEDMSNIEDALLKIVKLIDNEDIHIQKEISVFFEDILTWEGFLKQTIGCIKNTNGRIRKYSDSAIKETVLKNFPEGHTFSKYEDDPAEFAHSMTIRKAIILLFYMNYAYEYSAFLADYQYQPSFEVLGFNEFCEELDEILNSCELASLYPANQFDWLILRSIYKYEEASSDELDEQESPVAFFDQVIDYSFINPN